MGFGQAPSLKLSKAKSSRMSTGLHLCNPYQRRDSDVKHRSLIHHWASCISYAMEMATKQSLCEGHQPISGTCTSSCLHLAKMLYNVFFSLTNACCAVNTWSCHTGVFTDNYCVLQAAQPIPRVRPGGEARPAGHPQQQPQQSRWVVILSVAVAAAALLAVPLLSSS